MGISKSIAVVAAVTFLHVFAFLLAIGAEGRRSTVNLTLLFSLFLTFNFLKLFVLYGETLIFKVGSGCPSKKKKCKIIWLNCNCSIVAFSVQN
jgi:hypothetical protein